MPAESKNQKTAAVIAEQIKKGKQKAKPGTPSAEMAKMSLPDIKDFAQTPTGNLPKKAARKKTAKPPGPAKAAKAAPVAPAPGPAMSAPAARPPIFGKKRAQSQWPS